jgi:hypothetical protein
VKSLAAQTSKATEEIALHVGSIQASTGDAVCSIRNVASAMADIRLLAGHIASAVEERSAATREITGGTQRLAAGVDGLNGATSNTTHSAEAVLPASDHLSRQADRLGKQVEDFSGALRTARWIAGRSAMRIIVARIGVSAGDRHWLHCPREDAWHRRPACTFVMPRHGPPARSRRVR